MRIVVTGGDGFIARALRLRLNELGQEDVTSLTRHSHPDVWHAALETANIVFHLAGVNRPADLSDYEMGNAILTAELCEGLLRVGGKAVVVLSSSIQATRDNPYGRSKLHAEDAVRRYAETSGSRACILRLPNVFGKWARPNYNSAVATFCHNITRGIPIVVDDPSALVKLVYVEDVVDTLIALLPPSAVQGMVDVSPVYDTTVGKVAEMLYEFAAVRTTHAMPRVGTGFTRALYSTFVSYLEPSTFSYPLARHEDARGSFSEVLRTEDSGQVSYFTARPGVTRGNHYHHTKTEKFLVVKGTARFGFRSIAHGDTYSITVDGSSPTIVETVPGWAHNVTNIGSEDLVVMLWANETFDAEHPGTFPSKVET